MRRRLTILVGALTLLAGCQETRTQRQRAFGVDRQRPYMPMSTAPLPEGRWVTSETWEIERGPESAPTTSRTRAINRQGQRLRALPRP